MKFKLIHTSTYTFSEKVFLEPHYLRFRPQPSSFLTVLDFTLRIDPSVAGRRILLDEESNKVDFYWFQDLTNEFTCTATSLIELRAYNPFDFIIQPDNFNSLPFAYSSLQAQLLLAALQGIAVSQESVDYSDTILTNVDKKTLSFLLELTRQIHRDFSIVYRELGAPLEPAETFQRKSGSCRDVSWLLIGLLRHYKIAARFTSGYYYFEMEKPSYELHAWVTVFLPGVGWLGLDPSHGILTGNTHFALASSAHYSQTMPISGSIRGSAKSDLKTSLRIEKI